MNCMTDMHLRASGHTLYFRRMAMPEHYSSCAVLTEQELRLSIDTWTELLIDFVSNVIQRPVYVAGNSLGKCSRLKTIVASKRCCVFWYRAVLSLQWFCEGCQIIFGE